MTQLKSAGLEKAEAKQEMERQRKKDEQVTDQIKAEFFDLPPKEAPMADKSSLDVQTMAIISFGKQIGGLKLEDNERQKLVELLKFADEIGINMQEVAEAIK